MADKHKNFSVNFNQLHGRCLQNCAWKSEHLMHTCTICGMTEELFQSVRGEVNDDVSCMNYVDGQLILNRGAVVSLKLTNLGYEQDMHIALESEGSLQVNMQKNA